MDTKKLNDGSNFTTCTRQELKQLRASQFGHGDVIRVGQYFVYIRYRAGDKEYSSPALLSYVEMIDGKKIDCTPGTSRGLTPYFIDDFKSR